MLADFTIAHVLECADIVLMGNYVYKIMDTALMDAATTFFFLCAKVKTVIITKRHASLRYVSEIKDFLVLINIKNLIQNCKLKH